MLEPEEKKTKENKEKKQTKKSSSFRKERKSLSDEERRAFRRGQKRGALAGVIVCLVLVALVGLPAYRNVLLTGSVSGSSELLLDESTIRKANQIFSSIQSLYYEDVDADALEESMLAGIFDSLDDYSQYFTAEEYTAYVEENISGTFSGIGAQLTQDSETGTVEIVWVYEDTPAKSAGLEQGDIILQAGDYAADEMELSDFVSHIQGEAGTTVTLLVQKAATGKQETITLTREEIDIPTVASEMMDDGVGYVALRSFKETTLSQFEEAITDLQAQGMTSLIIDLRYNGGGLLNSAVDCLDRILPEGLLVYTVNADDEKEEYNSTDEETLDLPIIVLVNESTASASEIFTGALKDRNAATVIGTTTYGKGIVQTMYRMSDNSGFKLTTARYYTPSGVCIQGTGIEPDIELEYTFLGDEEDSYSIELDNQVMRAFELLTE